MLKTGVCPWWRAHPNERTMRCARPFFAMHDPAGLWAAEAVFAQPGLQCVPVASR